MSEHSDHTFDGQVSCEICLTQIPHTDPEKRGMTTG